MTFARPGTSSVLRLSTASLLALASLACGGGQKPAESPEDPTLPLEDPGEEEAPPSSPEVKAAIEKIKAEQYAEAETILAKAVADSPEDAQAAFFYGVALEGVGKKEQAGGQYQRAIDLMPQLIEASQNLSALLLAQEKNEEALQVADAGLKQAPQDPALLANRALALDMLERPEAIGAYEALLAVAPDDQANRFNYAVVLFLNQRTDDAKAELDKIQPQEPGLLLDMERLYLEMRHPSGCLRLWNEVLAQNKTDVGLAHRARCKLLSGDKKGAEADLRDALTVVPQSTIAHFYLGVFLDKEGQAAEGKKHLQQAAQGSDEFAQAAKKELGK